MAEVRHISDGGLFCKNCRSRRPWSRLFAAYNAVGTDIIRSWFCDRCMNLLREDNMTAMEAWPK